MKTRHAVLSDISGRYPATFCDPPVPLKIGIREDILSFAADIAVSKNQTRKALRIWTRRSEYQAQLIAGSPRYGLTGQPEGPPVSEEQAIKACAILTDAAKEPDG